MVRIHIGRTEVTLNEWINENETSVTLSYNAVMNNYMMNE